MDEQTVMGIDIGNIASESSTLCIVTIKVEHIVQDRFKSIDSHVKQTGEDRKALEELIEGQTDHVYSLVERSIERIAELEGEFSELKRLINNLDYYIRSKLDSP